MTEREARKLAKEVVSDEYAVIDEIWNRRRVNYHSVAADYDRDTIKDINRKLPNLLVKNGGVALDELADEYGFESTCDLIDMFLAYTPKRVRLAVAGDAAERDAAGQRGRRRLSGLAGLSSL